MGQKSFSLSNFNYSLLLFSSVLLTIKTIYKMRGRDNNTVFYLSFSETNKILKFEVDEANLKNFNFLFKGNTITIHSSKCGNYMYIQEGDHMPKKNHLYIVKNK